MLQIEKEFTHGDKFTPYSLSEMKGDRTHMVQQKGGAERIALIGTSYQEALNAN